MIKDGMGALEDKFVFKTFGELIEKFKIKKIIETGTYKGWSALELSKFGLPVHTIEFMQDWHNDSVEYLKECNNVTTYLGNSTEHLDKILEENEEGVLIFLDSHWYGFSPIMEEFKVIHNKKLKNPVIIIHDFFVPDEHGNHKFGFDIYQNLGVLNFALIEESINNIYNNRFDYHYNSEIDPLNAGVIYIYPKIEN
jgi:hypothetical protein